MNKAHKHPGPVQHGDGYPVGQEVRVVMLGIDGDVTRRLGETKAVILSPPLRELGQAMNGNAEVDHDTPYVLSIYGQWVCTLEDFRLLDPPCYIPAGTKMLIRLSDIRPI